MVSLPIYVDCILWYLVSFLVLFPSPDAFLSIKGHIKPDHAWGEIKTTESPRQESATLSKYPKNVP